MNGDLLLLSSVNSLQLARSERKAKLRSTCCFRTRELSVSGYGFTHMFVVFLGVICLQFPWETCLPFTQIKWPLVVASAFLVFTNKWYQLIWKIIRQNNPTTKATTSSTFVEEVRIASLQETHVQLYALFYVEKNHTQSCHLFLMVCHYPKKHQQMSISHVFCAYPEESSFIPTLTFILQ